VTHHYDTRFTVRALPSFTDEDLTQHPEVLLWIDAGYEVQDEWFYALRNHAYQLGVDYDTYLTLGAEYGLYNGLGARSEPTQLSGYRTILYTSGGLQLRTLGNGDLYLNPSPDSTELDTWLRQGDKRMFLTGDNLASDLDSSDPGFRLTWLGVHLTAPDHLDHLDGQLSPSVLANVVGPGPGTEIHYTAFGGGPTRHTFDVVNPAGGSATRFAEFLSTDCQPGQYPDVAAGVRNHDPEGLGNKIVYLPYGFASIHSESCLGYESQGPVVPVSARAYLLSRVLEDFGHTGTGPPSDVPGIDGFTSRQFPNPFNPTTRFEYHMPQAGKLSIRIYNLRGALIRTLIDSRVEAGPGFVDWDGTDSTNGAVASGVYFYELRRDGQVQKVGKMSLIR
jgi:hypothetical protein